MIHSLTCSFIHATAATMAPMIETTQGQRTRTCPRSHSSCSCCLICWRIHNRSSFVSGSSPPGTALSGGGVMSLARCVAHIVFPCGRFQHGVPCVVEYGMTWLLAVFLRPVAALVMFGLIALPLRLAFQKWMPDSKFKRFLLRPIGRQKAPLNPK